MPTQYSQARTRGFAPLFRGPYSDQHMRVSDAERQAVADRLAEHFGDGRLDSGEFDERIAQAMSAKTQSDLAGLLDDLPETGAPAGPAPAGRRRPARSFLGLVLLIVILMAAAHAVVHLAAGLLWIGLLAAVVIVAARGAARTRAPHDQRQ